MSQEVMALHVDTGSKLYNIDDKGEIIGQFRFNPSDLDIARRYDQVIEKLNTISVSEKPSEEEVFAITDEIKVQFDYLLNYSVSEQIFAKANPFTPLTNGDFYFENVIEGIRNIIEQETNQRLEKRLKKIKKATAKYHKE